jgi:predicted permease
VTQRLRKAARRERARRLLAMYVISGLLFLVLLAPLWLLLLIAARR